MDLPMERPNMCRINVGATERKVSLATGLALLSYLVRKRPNMMLGVPLGLEAGYMLYRGATGHCVVYDMMDINRSDDGHKGLTLKMGQTHVHRYLKPLFEMIERGEVDPSFIVTHIFPLEDAPDAYETFKHKVDGCVKVVMKPQ